MQQRIIKNLTSIVEDIQQNINELKIPMGYEVKIGGQYENAIKSSQMLLWIGIAAIVVIFFLLYFEFKKLKLALLVLINLPNSHSSFSIWRTTLTSSLLSFIILDVLEDTLMHVITDKI